MSAAGEAIVISGASTGIGLDCAERFAHDGFIVFAGVRNDADAARLESAARERARAAHGRDRCRRDRRRSADGRLRQHGAARPGEQRRHRRRGTARVSAVGATAPSVRRELLRRARGDAGVSAAAAARARAHRVVGSISGRLACRSSRRTARRSSRCTLRPMHCASNSRRPACTSRSSSRVSVKTPIWKRAVRPSKSCSICCPPQRKKSMASKLPRVFAATEGEEKSGMPVGRVTDAVVHAITAPKPHAYYLLGRRRTRGIDHRAAAAGSA